MRRAVLCVGIAILSVLFGCGKAAPEQGSAPATVDVAAHAVTAHAEVVAIRNACETLGDFSLKGCEIYSSCEPCPMCLSAICWSRADKLYFGGSRYDAADAGFDDELLYNEIPLDPTDRQMPSQQILREEAVEGFKQWKELDEKIEY